MLIASTTPELMPMARTKQSATNVEFEEQDISEVESSTDLDTDSETDEGGPNKSEAVRQALKAGYDRPAKAVVWIKEHFGIDMKPQHFSSVKSQAKSKNLSNTPPAKRGRKPKNATPPSLDGFVAPPEKTKVPGDPDILIALEGIKQLVGHFGADKVKRMVDIIG